MAGGWTSAIGVAAVPWMGRQSAVAAIPNQPGAQWLAPAQKPDWLSPSQRPDWTAPRQTPDWLAPD